jgi:hypothetical protein
MCTLAKEVLGANEIHHVKMVKPVDRDIPFILWLFEAISAHGLRRTWIVTDGFTCWLNAVGSDSLIISTKFEPIMIERYLVKNAIDKFISDAIED